jgi:hypothetical protein
MKRIPSAIVLEPEEASRLIVSALQKETGFQGAKVTFNLIYKGDQRDGYYEVGTVMVEEA